MGTSWGLALDAAADDIGDRAWPGHPFAIRHGHDPRIVLVAIALHILLSIVYGLFLAFVLPAVDKAWAVLIGGFYGLALYYINFYGFNAFSPWFADQRDWLSIACHFMFGAVLAYVYTTISARRASLRSRTVDTEASAIEGLGRAE